MELLGDVKSDFNQAVEEENYIDVVFFTLILLIFPLFIGLVGGLELLGWIIVKVVG